jgi:methylmalonyl-CoA/ethylmalonyl-CoA epimerase
MMNRIDHLGIAVPDLEMQIPLYRDQLGMAFEGIEEVPSQQVRVAFFKIGDSRIELLQSTSPDGPIAGFLAKRGEGIHHVAYQVADIRTAMAEAKARGLKPLSEEPRPGAHHTLVCFLHPKTTGGVLTELVQHAD